MMSERSCPALFIGSPASGEGKTTVTAALARHHRNAGRRVRVFKTGPDYLDPFVLELAAGTPVEQLDLWMAGEPYCRQRLHQAAGQADLLLIEGAMGLFDGEPSGAELAALTEVPVAAVFDAKGKAQTLGALALGLTQYRSDLSVTAVVANRVSSERHRSLLEQGLRAPQRLAATLPRDDTLALPQRHLGLIPPDEQQDLDARIDAAAERLNGSPLSELPAEVTFPPCSDVEPERHLQGRRVAVARDAAFNFIYRANLALLEAMGAELEFFSPLADSALPWADALWLPGGYPELHLDALAANEAMQRAVTAFYLEDRPILAECGGMLFLQQTLTGLDGEPHSLAGVIPGHGYLRDRPGCQGLQTAPLPEGEIRGHAHHRTRSEGTLTPLAHGRRATHPAPGEAIVRSRGLTATYLHLFFPSNPAAVAALLSGPVEAELGVSRRAQL